MDGRNRMPVACRGWEDRRVGSRGDGDVTARPELGAWALTGVAGLAGGVAAPRAPLAAAASALRGRDAWRE